MAVRRGRRGARQALLRGPSASPLEARAVASTLGKRVFLSVGVLIGVAGIVGVVLAVYLRIGTGHGADAFQNGYGQYETWGSYAGLLVAAPLILLGILLIRRWQLWRRSRLEGISAKEILKELKRDR